MVTSIKHSVSSPRLTSLSVVALGARDKVSVLYNFTRKVYDILTSRSRNRRISGGKFSRFFVPSNESKGLWSVSLRTSIPIVLNANLLQVQVTVKASFSICE